MPHPLMESLPSNELQQVLFHLSNLEMFLMNQFQDDLAKLITKRVVEQLREAPSRLVGPTKDSTPVSQSQSVWPQASEDPPSRLNTDDILRETDALITEIGPSGSGAKSKVSKWPARFPPNQPFGEAAHPDVEPVQVVTEKVGNTRESNGQPDDGNSMHLVPDEESQTITTPRQRSSERSEESFVAESAHIAKVMGDSPYPMDSYIDGLPIAAALSSDVDVLRQSLLNAQAGSHNSKIEKLGNVLEFTEGIDADDSPRKTISQMIAEAEAHKKDNALDVTVATIIVLNAIVIGISMDYKHGFWQVMDIFFTICFLCELGLKFKFHGCRNHFSSIANCLDFMLVVLDVAQLFLETIMQLSIMDNLPAASMFRVIRLARLTRLIRLARLRVFDELVAMISGLVGGMTTLMWSIVFFGLIVYITSLLFREFYGNDELRYLEEDITSYFSSVPRSMYTTFRYFFGDFTTASGISLFEAILFKYGTPDAIFVSLLFFMITIGLFNVIAAIFVESTLAAAYALQNSRKTERMNDELLWGRRISILVRKFFECTNLEVTDPLSRFLDENRHHSCDAFQFERFINDPVVVKALCDLEIADEDHKYLFDILDNDNTGEIRVSQLSDGVERLRGDPRRSDIICVDLMVRSLQEQMNYLVKATQTKIEFMQSIKRSCRRLEEKFGMKRPTATMALNDLRRSASGGQGNEEI